MSNDCKVVKRLSWLLMLIGVVAVVLGIVTAVGGQGGDQAGAPLSAQLVGIVAALVGVLDLASGVSGALGANSPVRLGGFIVIAGVVTLANVAETVLCLVGGQGVALPAVAYVVVALVALVYAARARKAALDR